MELLGQIGQVAQERQRLQELNKEKTERYALWEGQNQTLLSEIGEVAQRVGEAESLLRDLTIKAFNETGSKQPAVGVGIRELTKLEYDPSEAFKWALEHKIALALDKKTFEGLAKSTPPDFVQTYKEIQATIATDLSEAFKGGK